MAPRLAFFAPVLIAGLVLTAAAAHAQEVSPRWTFTGRGVLSTALVQRGQGDFDPQWVLIDPADTHLRTQVDQALFEDSIASFALGARVTDLDSPLAPAYLFQIEGGIQSQHLVVTVGRTRRPTLGVMFPTLRDEDLLAFTHLLNIYSAGGLEEDALFSEVVSVAWREDMRWHAHLFLEALRDTLDTADPANRSDFEPNALGLRLYYDELPELARVERVKHVGVGVFAQRVDGQLAGREDLAVWQMRADYAMNVWPDPIHLFDLRATAVYQHGQDDQPLDDVTASWQSSYASTALGLRYLYAPSQLDRLQAALTAGYRELTGQDAREWRVVPTFVYMLGAGVDLVAQYAFSWRSDGLSAAIGAPDREHRLEIAFAYGFTVRLNDTINLPRDILNADYYYVPVN